MALLRRLDVQHPGEILGLTRLAWGWGRGEAAGRGCHPWDTVKQQQAASNTSAAPSWRPQGRKHQAPRIQKEIQTQGTTGNFEKSDVLPGSTTPRTRTAMFTPEEGYRGKTPAPHLWCHQEEAAKADV